MSTGDACSLTWWGHATTTIELCGVRILTDPVLTRRIAHLHRVGGSPPTSRAREADLVLISHLHSDHLHVPSLRQIAPSARIIAPAGTGRLLRREDRARLDEVDAGDVLDHEGLAVRAVPAAHDGSRWRGSRIRGPALGYVVDSGSSRVWFAGDTGLFDAMADLGPIDLAVLPIGGWGPTLGEDHLDPHRAAEAARRVHARHTVPIHYGTFWPIGLRRLHPASFRRLFEQPAGRFASLMAGMPGVDTRVLDIGETTHWSAL